MSILLQAVLNISFITVRYSEIEKEGVAIDAAADRKIQWKKEE